MPATPAFPLFEALAPVLENPGAFNQAELTGPRRWWAGPLDVEGLALSSVQCLATALSSVDPRLQAAEMVIDSARVAGSFGSISALRINARQPAGFAPLSGFFQTKDGWVRLHANYPHHEKALLQGLGARTPDDVPPILLQHTAADAERLIQSAGGIASQVLKPGERKLIDAPWIRFNLTTTGKTQRGVFVAKGQKPLQGLRILDLTRVIAGPSASRLLAAFGADVLRIDPPAPAELEDQHVDTGLGKHSAIADLNDRDTWRRVDELAGQADAVLLGYKARSLKKLNIDPESLLQRHPHLAVVSLDAWGPDAPENLSRGFDSIVQAGTGISYVYGAVRDGVRHPGALPVQALDHATGMGMAAAVLGLVQARRNGISGTAHLSLVNSAAELLRRPVPTDPAADLQLPEPRRFTSSFGDLRFMPPALTTQSNAVEYSAPPVAYGSSPLQWV